VIASCVSSLSFLTERLFMYIGIGYQVVSQPAAQYAKHGHRMGRTVCGLTKLPVI
jgi:hypothetical protein